MTQPARSDARARLLLVAAAIVGLQGAGMLIFAVLEVVHTSSGNAGVAITTAVFFVLLGVGLLVCARGLAGLESWARGPVVAAELIELLTAYSFLGGDTTLVAVVLGVVAIVVIGCVFHPASLRAMAASDA